MVFSLDMAKKEGREADDSRVNFVSILEFAESSVFCGLKLFPVQRFLLKLVYGLPLSDDISDDPIIIREPLSGSFLHQFDSELEFLDHLYETDRINSKVFNYPLTEVYLIVGRRGTKTTLSSIMGAYSLYQLLLLADPYEYFGVLKVNEIGVALVSNEEGNASRQAREIGNLVYRTSFFAPFLFNKDPNLSGFQLKTKPMLVNPKDKSGRLNVSVFAASPSVRGGSNVVVVFDEFAHLVDFNVPTAKKGKREPLDEYIYKSLTPSTSGFKDKSGTPFGKAIFITSPNGKRGRCWKVKTENKDNPNRLIVNMPTWYVNPVVDRVYYTTLYNESVRSFRQEYGAEFIDVVASWLEDESYLNACFEPGWGNVFSIAKPKYYYFGGLDLALSGDATAFSICHFEKFRDRKVKEDRFTGIVSPHDVFVFDYVYEMRPVSGEELLTDEIIDMLVDLSKAFSVHHWAYDQWSAKMFRQWLVKRGFRYSISEITVGQSWNSDMGRLFKLLLKEGRIIIPDDEDLREEMLDLKEEIRSNSIKLENASGRDDRFSSMLKALHLCYKSPLKDQFRNFKELEKKIRVDNKQVLGERTKRDAKNIRWARFV